ncbi:F-box/kelch-repeat protein At3g23880-like [Papaver somniferum]|uniref:F-box/kelch-repeat protein At3g23880-like n=1 Tax=Papaver somniferum TaxID=3469 RepID=UPI000E6F5468|nr:F-box/kelch-repeat protein At3g23880-like [Papaver somniferum]
MFTDKDPCTGRPLIYSIDYASITSTPDVSCDYIDNAAVLLDTPFEYEEGLSISVLGACNGLICFDISINKEKSSCIWNPATREYKKLQRSDSGNNYLCRAGFGYDIKTGDYKIVRIPYSKIPDYCEVEVYTFGSHLSKTTHAFPYDFPVDVAFCCAFLNGALHWTRSIPLEDTSNCIVSFNISNKKLMDVPLPEKSIIDPEDSNRVGVLGDCLSLVLVHKSLDRAAEVWTVQDYGVRESWTKLFTTTQKPITKYTFLSIPMLSLKTGEILIYSYDGVILFDPKNEKVGNVSSFFQKSAFSDRLLMMMIAHPESYVESLVSLNSGTYVKKPIRDKTSR